MKNESLQCIILSGVLFIVLLGIVILISGNQGNSIVAIHDRLAYLESKTDDHILKQLDELQAMIVEPATIEFQAIADSDTFRRGWLRTTSSGSGTGIHRRSATASIITVVDGHLAEVIINISDETRRTVTIASWVYYCTNARQIFPEETFHGMLRFLTPEQEVEEDGNFTSETP